MPQRPLKDHQWGATFDVKCPRCGAAPGKWCVKSGNRRADPPHSLRVDKAVRKTR